MTTVTPGSRRPAYQELADRLRARIRSGELRPGDRLPVEPDLCAQYGVSRPTVREALRLLSSESLITTKRGVSGGSFVTYPDPDAISASLESGLSMLAVSPSGSVPDLLEIRELLEAPAAALAARRRTSEQLRELRAAMFDPRKLAEDEIITANRNFHLVLLRAAKNPLLEAVTKSVFAVLNDRFLQELTPARFWYRVDRDHREILASVEAGDESGARAAQQVHLQHLRGTYTRIDRRRRASVPSAPPVV